MTSRENELYVWLKRLETVLGNWKRRRRKAENETKTEKLEMVVIIILLVPRPSHRCIARGLGTLPVFSAKILAAPIRLLTDGHVT